jgi:hypothetical protein
MVHIDLPRLYVEMMVDYGMMYHFLGLVMRMMGRVVEM